MQRLRPRQQVLPSGACGRRRLFIVALAMAEAHARNVKASGNHPDSPWKKLYESALSVRHVAASSSTRSPLGNDGGRSTTGTAAPLETAPIAAADNSRTENSTMDALLQHFNENMRVEKLEVVQTQV